MVLIILKEEIKDKLAGIVSSHLFVGSVNTSFGEW